jgi:hypothetical protein
MRFDDTRDNTTDIEATIIEADAREEVFGRPVRPFPQPEERHEEVNDGANGYDDDDDDDIEEDDGQPSEYTEWQDFMGGDEYYDHSENGMW